MRSDAHHEFAAGVAGAVAVVEHGVWRQPNRLRILEIMRRPTQHDRRRTAELERSPIHSRTAVEIAIGLALNVALVDLEGSGAIAGQVVRAGIDRSAASHEG